MKPLRVGHECVELQMIHPVYKTKTKKVRGTGEVQEYNVLEKELLIAKTMDINAIASVEEFIQGNEKIKDRSIIYDKNASTFYAVKHSYADMVAVKYGKRKEPIGYGSHFQTTSP